MKKRLLLFILSFVALSASAQLVVNKAGQVRIGLSSKNYMKKNSILNIMHTSFRILILIICALNVTAAYADYQIMLENEKVWETTVYYVTDNGTETSQIVSISETKVVGDTIVNDISAKILIKEWKNNGITTFTTKYVLSEKEGVISFYDQQSGNFVPLYDFSKHLGEKMARYNYNGLMENGSYYVNNESTVILNNHKRRVLTIGNNNKTVDDSDGITIHCNFWIEGVGAYYPEKNLRRLAYPISWHSDIEKLEKCYKGDEVYYSRREFEKQKTNSLITSNLIKRNNAYFLVWPDGLNNVDSYLYQFLGNPFALDEDVLEVAFSGYTYIPYTLNRNWGYDFSVPNSVQFHEFEYFVVRIDSLSTDIIHNLTIPSSVRRLSDASISTPSLESLRLPSSLQTIGYSIFPDCSNLKKVEIDAATPPSLCNDEGETIDITTLRKIDSNFQLPFANINASCKLIVPEGTAESYRKDPVFRRFPIIEERNFSQSVAGAVESADFAVEIIPGGLVVSSDHRTEARIYRVDGTAVKSLILGSCSTVIELPQGLYIVRTADRSVKVSVR